MIRRVRQAALLALLTQVALVVGLDGAAVAARATGVQPVAQTVPAGYPTSPPAQICGNAAVLDGPAYRPRATVRVDPGANLNDLTQANPPGTRFWLAPGTHTLGTGEFDQVIPKDRNRYTGAPGAILDGQGVNRYAFTQKASGVTIEHLTIKGFVPPQDEAAVNHDSGSGWTVQYNTIRDVAMAAMNAGPSSVTRFNCITANGQTGINGLTGTSSVTVDHNEIGFNAVGPLAPPDACGCKAGVKLFGVHDVVITSNWIHDNGTQAVWADTNAVGWLIEGNYINNNGHEAIFFETSYNALIRNNTIANNTLVKGAAFAARNDSFPIAAVYISESGGDSRVYGGTYSTLEITGNNFDNNWGGVTLWEDPNRFCNTPGNTAPGFCPIAGVASPSTCVAGTIEDPPYYADCRWHTQNVHVHDNVFRIDKAALGCEGTRCGENSIFSEPATSPSWSPYLGDTIMRAITFEQNNRFFNNTYIGDWNANVFLKGQRVTFAEWQAAPYNQDAGSTILRSNLFDSDTSTLEGSIGHWIPWYSSTVTRSTAVAHSGSNSLEVGVGGRFWGVTLDNYPYFAASAGPKTISFWGRTPSAGTSSVTMEVTWRDAGGAVLGTDRASIPALTGSWQQATAAVTAPTGTVTAGATVYSSSGVAGTIVHLDDFVIADGGAAPPPPPPPPPGNALDADTATMEGSVGHWVPWYSSTVAATPTHAHTGSRSLEVGVGGTFWGVTLDNYPYFAATAGQKTISFWAMAAAGGQDVTMEVTWRDANGGILQTVSTSIPGLTSSWQQASASATAPPGTATVGVTLRGSSGIAGSTIYLDDLVVTA